MKFMDPSCCFAAGAGRWCGYYFVGTHQGANNKKKKKTEECLILHLNNTHGQVTLLTNGNIKQDIATSPNIATWETKVQCQVLILTKLFGVGQSRMTECVFVI